MSTVVNVRVSASNRPTPAELNGDITMSPLGANTAPTNLSGSFSTALMSTVVKLRVVGSNTPTLLTLKGAKTTRPLLAAAAPLYLAGLEPTWGLISVVVNSSVAGSNTPTLSPLYGAQTTRPLLTWAAPLKFSVYVTAVAMLTVENARLIGLNRPMAVAHRGTNKMSCK